MKKIRLKRGVKENVFDKDNESKMKKKGENRVFKSILNKNNGLKSISSTQKGQQLLIDESIRVLPLTKDWILNKSGSINRSELKNYFLPLSEDNDNYEEFLLQKILETYFHISGSIYMSSSKNANKSRHKKIASIEKHITNGLGFDNTFRFVETIISFSTYFNTVTETENNVSMFGTNNIKKTVKYTTNLSEIILEDVSHKASMAFYPLPMLEKPLDWEFKDDEIIGGYKSFQYEMVRSHNKFKDYNKLGNKIFDSINYIQSVPWKVNKDVLVALKSDIKMPVKSDYVKLDFPKSDKCRWDIIIKYDKELDKINVDQVLEQNNIDSNQYNDIILARKEYKNKSLLYNAEVSDYESAVGKYRYAKLAIKIAEQYLDQTIYFPHNFDFRGRIYPLPIGLSPQGSDAIKALLLYDNSETLTKRGLQWCWAYLASLYGDDKLDFEKRIERGKELIDTNYLEADEPYQFLAHQLELKKYLSNNGYKPSIRIHLDACNSGSQFTSAITGDLAGCKATNVVPIIDENNNQSRQDAYILVSDRSIELCNNMLENKFQKDVHKELSFFKQLLENKGRKICKKPVMVSNYGGTAGGRANAMWDMMRELKVERQWITKQNANLFGKVVGESITGVLNGGKSFEIYIQKMNNLIAKDNKPVIWTTSDGFYVLHQKHKELKPVNVSCKIPGSRKITRIRKKSYSNMLSSQKMKSAISPNYIHSLDAELLRRVALRMRDLGVLDTDWIHDSFGSHPNHIDKLLEITKEEFLDLMLNDPLNTLDIELKKQIPKDSSTKRELNKISMPRLGNDNFIQDLEKVLLSNWFFS